MILFINILKINECATYGCFNFDLKCVGIWRYWVNKSVNDLDYELQNTKTWIFEISWLWCTIVAAKECIFISDICIVGALSQTAYPSIIYLVGYLSNIFYYGFIYTVGEKHKLFYK